MTLTFQGHVTGEVIGHVTIQLAMGYFLWVVDCDQSGTVIDMAIQRTCTHTHTQNGRQKDKTTNLLISSKIHFVHIGGDNELKYT